MMMLDRYHELRKAGLRYDQAVEKLSALRKRLTPEAVMLILEAQEEQREKKTERDLKKRNDEGRPHRFDKSEMLFLHCTGPCGQWLPETKFHQRTSARFNRASRCKECFNLKYQRKKGFQSKPPRSKKIRWNVTDADGVRWLECSKCGGSKPEVEFSKNTGAQFNRATVCKVCQKERISISLKGKNNVIKSKLDASSIGQK